MKLRLLISLAPFILLIAGCSPEPVFRMSPERGPTTYYQGTEYTTTEQDSLFVTLAYYRHIGDMFAMDVEVYNKRDTTVRIDPARFGALALGSYADSTFDDFLTYNWALDPEQQLLEIDKRISRHRASEKTAGAVLLTSVGVGVTAAILAGDPGDENGNNEGDDTNYTYIDYGSGSDVDYEELELQRKRETWELDALRITDLQPGEYVHGLVFFENVEEAAGYKLELNIGESEFVSHYLQRKIKP